MQVRLSGDSQNSVIRARAPMRISFAGGGSELSPFREDIGGKVINATISMYAHVLLVPRTDDSTSFLSLDLNEKCDTSLSQLSEDEFETENSRLAAFTAHHLIMSYGIRFPSGFDLIVNSDAPVGSGLGASSTMTVAIVDAMLEFAGKRIDPYSLATLAHEIERKRLNLSGGVQDQFCAAFGGLNFMEFGPREHVLINPLRLHEETLFDLESSLLLVYTGTSRESAKLIESQTKALADADTNVRQTLSKISDNALDMKYAILRGDLKQVGNLLDQGWNLKRSTAPEVSNPEIDSMYEVALSEGAYGGKLCGAGGGGYLLLVCPSERRQFLRKALTKVDEPFQPITLTGVGSRSWSSQL
jgi:D-glycero-alpha-D-manno-heptose-7-phosphate kinase